MSPSRKRRIRLIVALTAATILSAALVYTSFSAASEAVQPSALIERGASGQSYQLTGKVVEGTIRADGDAKVFRVRDRDGDASVQVRYVGAVPDTFKAGREIIITVRKQGAEWVGDKDSLITKCPSKFSDKPAEQT